MSSPQSPDDSLTRDIDLVTMKHRADAGDSVAQVYYGLLYHLGHDVPCDNVIAAHYFGLAADQGEQTAQLYLGLMLKDGNGIPADKVRATHYLQLAADQGEAAAQLLFGLMLKTGDGIPPDKVRAAYYLQFAADQGDMNAQFQFGAMLQFGDGIPEDKARAAHYFQLGADQGEVTSALHFGVMLQFGDGIPQNKARAVPYFTLAAEHGVAWAQHTLGVMLMLGDGIPKDVGLAIHYFKLAADQGHKEAQQVCMKLSLIDHSLESIVEFLSGNNGRFHFEKVRGMVKNMKSPLGDVLRRALTPDSPSNEELIREREVVSVFGILKSSGLGTMRILVARLRPRWIAECRIVATWKELQNKANDWLSHFEQSGSFEDIMKLPFTEGSPFAEMNWLLRRFPITLIVRCVKEFDGLLSCATLLQAVIEDRAVYRDPCIVYRGFRNGGNVLAGLYASVIGEIVIWRGFTIASKDRDLVVKEFASGRDGILFQIALGLGTIAADGEGCDVIIAAESGFKICSVDVEMGILVVKLEWVSGWSEADLEFDPRDLLSLELGKK
jgi:TPR repeat protein